MVYYGADASAVINSSLIGRLNKIPYEGKVNRQKIELNKQYAYFAFPESFDSVTFTVGVLSGGFNEPVSLTIDGVPYNVYRSTKLLTGEEYFKYSSTQMQESVLATDYRVVPNGDFALIDANVVEFDNERLDYTLYSILRNQSGTGEIKHDVETNKANIARLSDRIEEVDAKPANYTTATGKPSINGHTLAGEMTGEMLDLATLNDDGKIPESMLPSYVDDVLEYANKAAFPVRGESGKIYVDLSTNLTWRWSGSTYVEISPSLALGETASTAYAGNKGKQVADNLNTHTSDSDIHITETERQTWNAKSGTDNKVAQTYANDNAEYRVLFSGTASDTSLTEGAKKTGTIRAIPGIGALKFNGWIGIVHGNEDIDLDDISFSDNMAYERHTWYTTGSSSHVSNKPVADNPFVLEFFMIRRASVTDYLSKQIYHGYNKETYERYCRNGTWSAWQKLMFTDTTYSDATQSAKGLMTAADKTKLDGIAAKATAVTESTVSGWGFTKNAGTYSKPSGGIPKTDLASAVQTSLGKADTALQSYTEKYTGTYSKPSGGIPKTDLASAVQTSLGKADTALQQHQSLADYVKNLR